MRQSASGQERSPFVPGQGQIPPFLAGREAEQELVQTFLDELGEKSAPATDIFFYGPRGNGKTTLMQWARREAAARKIETIAFYAAEIRSEEWLVRQLSVRQLSVLPPWLRALSSVSALGIGVKVRDSARGRISDILARRARKRPILIAIDEAHILALEPGRALLNAAQELRGMGLPVMLLLAGTPDLPRNLNSMGASLWERSVTLRIGLLGQGAAAKAIGIPLERNGRSIESDALAQVADESHGYPFFVQLWGRLLWENCSEPSRPITCYDVNLIKSQFQEARDQFYLNRYDELTRAELSSVAASMFGAFVHAKRTTLREVNKIIKSSLELEGRASDNHSVTAAFDRLHDLGYIWTTVHQSRHYLEPGIPSLMRFVARSEGLDTQHEES